MDFSRNQGKAKFLDASAQMVEAKWDIVELLLKPIGSFPFCLAKAAPQEFNIHDLKSLCQTRMPSGEAVTR
jgi:hypothetical protein